MEAVVPQEKLGLVLRLAFYVFIAWIGLIIFAVVLTASGYFIGAAGSVFGAAITANALGARIFERLPLTAVGLGWHRWSGKSLAIGTAAGAGAAALVTFLPMVLGLASLAPDSERPASAAGALFVTIVLLFGAIGEELLFRGYGFQVLVRLMGPVPTLTLTAALFGWMHMQNLHATALGIANTAGFGVVLGYAFLRTGELWLPIGIHFGWNWMLPVAGVNVSGFKIGMTGYELRWNVPEIWSGGAYGPEASVLTSVVIVLLLIFLRQLPITRVETIAFRQHGQQES